MAGDRKGPGGSRDVDDLKARLGLKVPRKAPPPAAAPAPIAPPAHEAYSGETTAGGSAGGATFDATVVGSLPARHDEAVPQTQPFTHAAQGHGYAPPGHGYAPPGHGYAPPAAYAQTEPTPRPALAYVAPLYVEEPPPPRKSLWQRMGRPALIALLIAAGGGVVGYLVGKGAAIRAGYAKVKGDAVKIDAVVKEAYSKIEEVASLVDPGYAAARKAGQDPQSVRTVMRQDVDWASLEALEKVEPPKELESIFETDYKRFNRLTVKSLVSFYIDMTRLFQGLHAHAATTKAARAQLDAEAKQGSGPRAFGIISAGLPNLERGEIVLLRGRRSIKQGAEETFVVDVAKRSAPTQPIAIPEANVLLLNAPGLIKTSGSLLEEFNRRNREVAETLRRLLEVRGRLQGSMEQIIAQIKG